MPDDSRAAITGEVEKEKALASWERALQNGLQKIKDDGASSSVAPPR